MRDFVMAPWPWYVAGPIIAAVMVLMLFFGKSFGISSTLRTMCSMSGGGKWSDYFKFDWRSGAWNMFFIVGTIIGGYIASTYMTSDQSIDLNAETISYLESVGVVNAGESYLPVSIFSWDNLFSFQGWIFMVLGGLLVGFGARYAEGCTSGHAIFGLSNLQWPSLVAVIGFFMGGLIVTHMVLPFIF